MAYAGDNQNVIQCAKFRLTENRIARYFRLVANRLEADVVFTFFLTI